MLTLNSNGILKKTMSFLRLKYVKLYFRKSFKCLKGIHISRNCKIIIKGKYSLIEFGNEVSLADNVHLQANENASVTIGNNCQINSYSRIVAMNKIEIGSNVAIAQFVTILDHNHAYTFNDNIMKLNGYDCAPIKIGNNVWIADKCTILKGVQIGDNVIVGAHTLVNKDVPPNCIIAGTPFKIIRQLKENVV